MKPTARKGKGSEGKESRYRLGKVNENEKLWKGVKGCDVAACP